MAKKAPQKKNTKPATKRAVPETNAHLTKMVGDNCPPNWKGTKDQYVQLYKGIVTGLKEEVERAIAKLFPKMATEAMVKEADLGKPVAEVDFSIKVDFTKYDIVQFSGNATHVSKVVDKVPLGHTEELSQMDFLKGNANPGVAPNGGKPEMTQTTQPAVETKDAPNNKAAKLGGQGGAKTKAGDKPPTPPVVTPPAEPGKK